MEFQHLLIRLNEVVHKSILEHKQKILEESSTRDITLRQLFYLEAVNHFGQTTVSELGKRLGYTNASVSNAVKKMTKMGLLRKSPSSEDGRAVRVELTEAGQQIIQAEQMANAELVDELKKHLTAVEVDQLAHLIHKIIVSMEG